MYKHYTQNAFIPFDRRAMKGAKFLPLPIHELLQANQCTMFANISI